MPKQFIEKEASIESEEEIELDEEIIEEPIKISKKTGKPVKKLSIKQLENLKLGRERGLVIKKCIAENTEITKTNAYIKKVKNLKIEKENEILKEETHQLLKEETHQLLKEDFDQAIKCTEPVRKSIKKKKKKYVQIECTDSESESDGIVIKKELIVTPPVIEDPFIAERLLKQKLYNDRVTAITNFMLNKK